MTKVPVPWAIVVHIVEELGSWFIPPSLATPNQVNRAIRRHKVDNIYTYPHRNGVVITTYNSCIAPLSKVPELIRMDYSKYLDGKTYRIHYGIDFTSTPEYVYRRLHTYVTNRGMRIYATWCTPLGWIEFRVSH